jgi:hypothetical protein
VHFRSFPKADLDSPWRPPHGGRWQFGVPEFLVGCKVFHAQVQARHHVAELPACALHSSLVDSRLVAREV